MAKPRSKTLRVVGKSSPLGSSRMSLPKMDGLKCPGCLNGVKYIQQSGLFHCYVCGGRFTSIQMKRHVDAMTKVVHDARSDEAKQGLLRIRTEEQQERDNARHAREVHSTAVVYFIRFRDAVKVGTTEDLTVRLAELPWEEIIGVVPGGIHEETKHHRRLVQFRIHGEWFELTDEVVEYVDEANKVNADWYASVFHSVGVLPIQRGTRLPLLTDYPVMG